MERHADNPAERSILAFLRQIQKRIARQRFLYYMARYGLIGAVFALGCNALTLWVPWYLGARIGFGGLGAILFIGLLHWLYRWPRRNEAAAAGDRAGLEERLVTSLERLGRTDTVSELQREETRLAIRDFSVAERFRLTKYPRWYLTAAFCLVLAVACACYPTAAKKQAHEQHALQIARKQTDRKIEQAEKALQEQQQAGELSESEQKALQEVLEAARKEIADSRSKQDLEKAGDRLETKLMKSLPEQMSAETANELQSLVSDQNLAETASYRQTIDSLAQNSEAVASAQQDLESLGELLDAEQKQALTEQLKQAGADGTVTADELSQALESLQDANASYTQAQIAGQSGSNGSSEQSSGGASGTELASNQHSGETDVAGSQSSSDGSGNGENSAGGTGSGTGQGGAGGTGSGTGQNGSGGTNGGKGGGASTGSEQGIERETQAGEAEKVWVPQETGEDSNLTGKKQGQSGSTRKSQSSGTQKAGKKADLSAVSGNYKKKAYDRLQQEEIPDSMQDIVKEYFSSLD